VDDEGTIQDSQDASPITLDGDGMHVGRAKLEPITLKQELYTPDENEPEIQIYTGDAVSGEAVQMTS
jgi:hypothetical protein